MAKKKIMFEVAQTGAIELTENLGSDPAFKVPVKITCMNSRKITTALAEVTGIYYHASEGWVPCNNDDELSLYKLIPDQEDLQPNLQSVIDDLGSTVLARLFRIGEALFDTSPVDVTTVLMDNDIDLNPIVKAGKANAN